MKFGEYWVSFHFYFYLLKFLALQLQSINFFLQQNFINVIQEKKMIYKFSTVAALHTVNLLVCSNKILTNM